MFTSSKTTILGKENRRIFKSVYGYVNTTTREGILKIHHLVYNQFPLTTLDALRQYDFQRF